MITERRAEALRSEKPTILFGFLVRLVCLAVRAELIQLKTSFDRLLVLRGLVVGLLTVRTGQLDQVVLGHRLRMGRGYAKGLFLASFSDGAEDRV